MGRFQYSGRAKSDLLKIGKDTQDEWGDAQADKYLSDLEACCQKLAGNPNIGRSCDEVRAGLLGKRQGRHIVFYRITPYGVRIVRVLHERMDAARHL